ncbi:MAG: alpha-galactosidase [Planctomycetes bacterium]|nr:alpha-galactosidase [Planctomycetota bacterium]
MGRWWVAATAALVLAAARAPADAPADLAAPAAVPAAPAPAEQYGILTPPAPPQPRVNGPRVFGVRPGRPVLFRIAASGERPIVYAARGLPEGLRVDAVTGAVSGRVAAAGEYVVTLEARSAAGLAARPMRLVVGDRIALTPPMGWNAWNCWSTSVDDRKIREAADAMVRSGLADHGWAYINIDDGWQGRRTPPEYALQPKSTLPDMKALADYVHGLGLKIGLYSTPWKTSYAGYPGGSADTDDGRILAKEHRFGAVAFDAADARQFAAWGIDYLKYDWKPNDVPHAAAMAEALRACGRDIVFSLSNAAPLPLAPRWAEVANAWRTTGDLEDSWASVSGVGFAEDPWRPFAGPGHWNDPDMLVVGHVGWGPKLRPTELTPNEQYAHVSLWCLLAAPLLLGCDLETLDPFTLALLVNDEVLAVNQDPLGRQAARVRAEGPLDVWAKDLEDGSKAVGLFNRADDGPRTVTVRWSDLGLAGRQRVRDLWRQADLGAFEGEFAARVLVHGVVLVRIAPEPSQ